MSTTKAGGLAVTLLTVVDNLIAGDVVYHVEIAPDHNMRGRGIPGGHLGTVCAASPRSEELPRSLRHPGYGGRSDTLAADLRDLIAGLERRLADLEEG